MWVTKACYWSNNADYSVNFVISNVTGAQKWLGIFESNLAVKYAILGSNLEISWQRGGVEFYKCANLFYIYSLVFIFPDFFKI